MPKRSSAGIPAIVNAFVTDLTTAMESIVSARVQQVIVGALGAPPKRGPGRPPKNGFSLPTLPALTARRRRPKQLCPVPGCNNPAAPVFGMVCKDHKDVPKATIKKYREARREATKGGNRGVQKAAAKTRRTGPSRSTRS
jgi:hypothetical protein